MALYAGTFEGMSLCFTAVFEIWRNWTLATAQSAYPPGSA
jgi:hypothetical protein